MKVLHINQSDIGGGAAIAGYRLHQGLLAQGIHSRQLVGHKETNSDLVAEVPRSRHLEKNIDRITRRLGFNYISHQTTPNITQHPFYPEADILNFHNLHGGYFNYLAIDNLTTSKPALFTLHDMWSFTGHCAYSYACNKWQTGCGQCPDLATYPAITRDTTAIEWKLKNWVYSRSNLSIITPSQWLADQARASMLSRFPIHHIPNGIDTDVYQPIENAQCRQVLNIPQGKHVLMFGAASLSDTRKGGDLLHKALVGLPESLKANTILLTLGRGGEAMGETIGIPSINLGYVGSDHLKAIAYSAADLFLFPTRADNLPLVLQESMACGTPMISYKMGGVPDLVRPGKTGYLAAPEDTEDFRNGIIQVLEDPDLLCQMAQNCRAIALAEYRIEQQADRYIALYQELLK
ncbi:MAG: glycosyltransferase [Acaryochloris sp. CRU_2_0]|nr:glycosyltransferase [Acaryochloris sp. CRU_2_0]